MCIVVVVPFQSKGKKQTKQTMGLGSGVAPAVCEHAVLTRTVDLAWPKNAPSQVWGSRKTSANPNDLLEVKTRDDCETIQTVIFDLTQLVFAFPKMGREWIRTQGLLPYATFEGSRLEEALTRCINAGWPIGTVEQLSNGRYVIEVDTFTDELLTGFLVDCLVDVRRGIASRLPNLKVAYYVLDGERPAAKTTTSKKRTAARCQGKDYELHRRVENFLGPDQAATLLKPVRIKRDGQDMWQGSLFDYLLCRENLWELVGRLREIVERTGGLEKIGVDVFVARGWHSRYHSSAGWFRLAGNRPETAKPLLDYFAETVDLEADAMMIRLGRFVVEHLNGPCLLSTIDTDVLVSMISFGSPALYWAKQLKFKNATDVVLRTNTNTNTNPAPGQEQKLELEPTSETQRETEMEPHTEAEPPTKKRMRPNCIDLRTLCPLDEPAIQSLYIFPKLNNVFFFSARRLYEPIKWSTSEAERRLGAVFVLLMTGCDFCEKVDSYGTRRAMQLLSQKPTLSQVSFSRITYIKHLTKDIKQGMRHDCLSRWADKVRFPWRCGDFVCLVEVTFESLKTLIQRAIQPKPIEGRDWKPFIRRLCYSVMTLSATGLGMERELRDNWRLAQNFGYDLRQGFTYIKFETEIE